jgi:broad specificity phosphatase PhoE
LEGTIYYKPHPPEALKTIEPMADFLGRLLAFFDTLFPPRDSGRTSALPDTGKDLTVLIVSHGGPIKVLLPALWQKRNAVWTPEAEAAGTKQKYKVNQDS